MSRLALCASILVLVLAAGAAALLVASRARTRGLAPAAALSVQASFDRSSISFGDAVVARVIARVDRGIVDAGRLSLVEDLAPLARLGPPRTWTVSRGRLRVVQYDVRVACLVEECVATQGPRRLQLPPVRVHAMRLGGGAVSATAAWPRLSVTGRVTPADVARLSPPFRRDLQPLEPRYSIEPSTLALLLEVAAVVLAVAGAALLARQVVLYARTRNRRTRQSSELALALEAVRAAQTRPPADRRRAVGWLAGLLRPRDERLAGAARRLAWSRPAPVPVALSELANEVSREIESS